MTALTDTDKPDQTVIPRNEPITDTTIGLEGYSVDVFLGDIIDFSTTGFDNLLPKYDPTVPYPIAGIATTETNPVVSKPTIADIQFSEPYTTGSGSTTDILTTLSSNPDIFAIIPPANRINNNSPFINILRKIWPNAGMGSDGLIVSNVGYKTGNVLVSGTITVNKDGGNNTIQATIDPPVDLQLYSTPEFSVIAGGDSRAPTIAGTYGTWVRCSADFISKTFASLGLGNSPPASLPVYKWISTRLVQNGTEITDPTDPALQERLFALYDSHRIKLDYLNTIPNMSNAVDIDIPKIDPPFVSKVELDGANTGTATFTITPRPYTTSVWKWTGSKYERVGRFPQYSQNIQIPGLQLGLEYTFIFCTDLYTYSTWKSSESYISINPSDPINVIVPLAPQIQSGESFKILDSHFPPLFQVTPKVGIRGIEMAITDESDPGFTNTFTFDDIATQDKIEEYTSRSYSFSDTYTRYISPDFAHNGRWKIGNKYYVSVKFWSLYSWIPYQHEIITFTAGDTTYDITKTVRITDNNLAIRFDYLRVPGTITDQYRPKHDWEIGLYDKNVWNGADSGVIWASGLLCYTTGNQFTLTGTNNMNRIGKELPIADLYNYNMDFPTNVSLEPNQTNFARFSGYLGPDYLPLGSGFGRAYADNSVTILTSSLGTAYDQIRFLVPLDNVASGEYKVEFDLMVNALGDRVGSFATLIDGTVPEIVSTNQAEEEVSAVVSVSGALPSLADVTYRDFAPTGWRKIRTNAILKNDIMYVVLSGCVGMGDKFVMLNNINVYPATSAISGLTRPHSLSTLMKITNQDNTIGYEVNDNLAVNPYYKLYDKPQVVLPDYWTRDRRVFTGIEDRRAITDISFQVIGKTPPYTVNVYLASQPDSTPTRTSLIYTYIVNSTDETVKVYNPTLPSWLNEGALVYWYVTITHDGVDLSPNLEYAHHRYDPDIPLNVIPFTYTSEPIVLAPKFVNPGITSDNKLVFHEADPYIYLSSPYYSYPLTVLACDKYPNMNDCDKYNLTVTSTSATNLIDGTWIGRGCTVGTGTYFTYDSIYVTKTTGVSEASLLYSNLIPVDQSGNYYLQASTQASGFLGSDIPSGVVRFGFMHYDKLKTYIGTDPGIYAQNAAYLLSGVIASGEIPATSWNTLTNNGTSLSINPPTIQATTGLVSDLFTDTAYVRPFIYISGNVCSGLAISTPLFISDYDNRSYVSVPDILRLINDLDDPWIEVNAVDDARRIHSTIVPFDVTYGEVTRTPSSIETIQLNGPYTIIDLGSHETMLNTTAMSYGDYVAEGYIQTRVFSSAKPLKRIEILAIETIPLQFERNVAWISYVVEFLRTTDTLTYDVISSTTIKALNSYAEVNLPSYAEVSQECYYYRVKAIIKRPSGLSSLSPKLSNIKIIPKAIDNV